MKMKSARTAMFIRVFTISAISLCAWRASGQDLRRLLAKPAPVYPDVAKRLRLEGTVKIEVIVGTDGEIKDTKVIGGHPVLVDAALKALKDWKYERATSETTLELEFRFHP